MRCPNYNIGRSLPTCLERDGLMIPCIEENFEELGILVLVEAAPDVGKVITKSHGEVVAGKWTEIIDEQKTPEEIEAAEEIAVQSAKPDILKQAENKFFDLIDEINSEEALDIAYTDTVDVLLEKASGLSMTRKAYYGMLLNSKLKEIEIYGGSWKKLPAAKHILEA